MKDIAPEFPRGKKKKEASPKWPTIEERREGFHSRNFTGQCESCWRKMKDHPICQACGALVGSQGHWQAPYDFREHTLCGSCVARWKHLNEIMRYAEGRDATWNEMMKGIHPVLKERKEEKTYRVTSLLATKIRDTTLSTQTANALVSNHIETIDKLIQKTPEELFRLRLLGTTKITEIKEFLSKKGLRLRRPKNN